MPFAAGYNPLLVLTMVDELDPTIRANPSSPSAVIKGLREQAAAELGIAPRQVMYCVNYTSEERSSSAIGKNTLDILSSAVMSARDFCQSCADTDRRPMAFAASSSSAPVFDWS